MTELIDYKNELNTHVVKNNLIDKIVEKLIRFLNTMNLD